MSTIIIVYDTKYGQTQRIADYVGEVARRQGHSANVVRVGSANALEVADAFVVLAPVFGSKHMSTIERFVMQNHETLNRRPTAFFSVSGTAGSKVPAERARAQKMASAFVASTPWRPQLVTSVGGALNYPRYNFFLRLVMKWIAKSNGGPTDTSRIHELTDWTVVEHATLDLLSNVEPKRATASSEQASAGAQP
jgi:menaquinone-dependent protoporphyrinogen oxidase